MSTYTVKEAAKILGMTPMNVRNRIYSGKIKAVKDENGLYKIEKTVIDALLINKEKPKKKTDFREEFKAHFEKIEEEYREQIVTNPKNEMLIEAMNKRGNGTILPSYDFNTCYNNFYEATWGDIKESMTQMIKIALGKKKIHRKKYKRLNGRKKMNYLRR